jgi:hypothetical protein
MGMLEQAARQGLQALGLKGVSTVAVVGTLAAYAYSRKVTMAGGVAISAASRTGSHIRGALVIGLVLLLLGVISVDTSQAGEIARRAWRVVQSGGWSVW